VCALAMALRFNEERPGHTMLIAGHTDSVGGEAGNQRLSEQRAELVHAVLMGNRDKFAEIAQATHKVSDYKQILKWASVTLSGLEPPEGAEHPAHDFAACDPGTIDDVVFTGIEPLKAFQRAYNANKAALGASAADLAVDGSIGPKTWGAIFDCYQFNMAQELGEVDDEADEANPTKLLEGLDRLRGMVTFLPLNEEWVGFGEVHPADGHRKDGAASQQNRRVEILFFESGQEPDVAILKEAPEITELYSPDAYQRNRFDAMLSAKRVPYRLRILPNPEITGKPESLRYAMVSDQSIWEQVKDVVDAEPQPDGSSLLTFRVPAAGAYSLVFMHRGNDRVPLYQGLPIEQLGVSMGSSRFPESPGADPQEVEGILELDQGYAQAQEEPVRRRS